MKLFKKPTKRLSYAETFRFAYTVEFTEANEGCESHFDITKQSFDEFLLKWGLVETDDNKMPDIGTADWAKWVKERQNVRAGLNEAARVGQHVDTYGPPPFRIDKHPQDNTKWRVQLLVGMVKVTYKDAANAINTLAKNKKKDITKMTQYFLSNKSELPLDLQFALGQQAKMLEKSITRVANELNDYLDDFEDTYKDAQAFIAASPKAQALTHNPEDDE
jgi:hypothetical protein